MHCVAPTNSTTSNFEINMTTPFLRQSLALAIAALCTAQAAQASTPSTPITLSSTLVPTQVVCNAVNELQLRDGIAKQKAGACLNNEVIVGANIALQQCDQGQGIFMDSSNLVLRGAVANPRYTISMGGTCLPEHGGVLAVVNGTNVKIADLAIRRPSSANRRSIIAARANNLNLQRLAILADANVALTPSVGLLISDTTGVSVESVIVNGGTGTGMLLRSTSNFKIFKSEVRNMVSGGVGADAAIQIDQLGSGVSQHGNISKNTIERVPGQGIFIHHGSYIAVKDNVLNDIATREGNAPDGGRGIYLNRGEYFWVYKNQINRVDGVKLLHTRNGAGIHASNCLVSKMVLEHNVIRNAGNSGGFSLPAGAETIGAASGGSWNGYGIAVRNEALVQYNTVENSSTYGILISPAANKVSVLFNPSLRYSNINNIKAVTGTAIDACRDANGVLQGASSKIEIQDNFIADAKLSGVNFETLSGPNSYQVSFLTNSIHRNDGGRRGIYLQGSGAGPWHYHAPYPSANWIGQTRYVELAGAISAGPAIKNDFGPLRNVIAQNAYMTWNP